MNQKCPIHYNLHPAWLCPDKDKHNPQSHDGNPSGGSISITSAEIEGLRRQLERAQHKLHEAVYGNEPFIDNEEVLKVAQECRSTENALNRAIANSVLKAEV